MTENAALSTLDYAEPALTGDARRSCGLSGMAWAKIGTIVVLMAALFWPNLRRLFIKVVPYWGEANWQHSFLIPLVGIYYLYLNRDELLHPERQGDAPARLKAFGLWVELQIMAWGVVFFLDQYCAGTMDRTAVQVAVYAGLGTFALGSLVLLLWVAEAGAYSFRKSSFRVTFRAGVLGAAESSATWFGLYVLIWGMVFYSWSIWPGQNDFFKDVSMVVALFGTVLMTCGWRTMRIAWFPILFLLCAIPWPPLMYSKIALPLQQLAASAAAWALRTTGVEAVRTGTKLQYLVGLNRRELNVAEACAGLKSLMTFVSLGAAIAFLSSRALWQKLIISFSAVPIAVFCNMMRVTGQGLMDCYVSEQWSKGFAHMFFGLLMLVPAFFLILLVAWILDNLFIEEVDRRAVARGAAGSPKSSLIIEAPRPSEKAAAAKPATAGPGAAPGPEGAAKAGDAAAKPAAASPMQSGAKPAAPAKPGVAPAAAGDDLAALTQRLTAARQPKRIVPPANAPKRPGPTPPRQGREERP